jgi:hypothetical protein
MDATSPLAGGVGLAFGGLPALRLSAQKPLPVVAGVNDGDGAPALRVRTASGRFTASGDAGGGGTSGGDGGGDAAAAHGGVDAAAGASSSHPNAPSPRDKNSFFSADPVPSPPAFSLDNDAVAPPPKAPPPPPRRDFFSSGSGDAQQDNDADGAVLPPPPPPPPRAAFGRRAAGAPARQRRGVSFAASLEVRTASLLARPKTKVLGLTRHTLRRVRPPHFRT